MLFCFPDCCIHDVFRIQISVYLYIFLMSKNRNGIILKPTRWLKDYIFVILSVKFMLFSSSLHYSRSYLVVIFASFSINSLVLLIGKCYYNTVKLIGNWWVLLVMMFVMVVSLRDTKDERWQPYTLFFACHGVLSVPRRLRVVQQPMREFCVRLIGKNRSNDNTVILFPYLHTHSTMQRKSDVHWEHSRTTVAWTV